MNAITHASETAIDIVQSVTPDFAHVFELPCYTKQDEFFDQYHTNIEVRSADDPLKAFAQAIKKMFVDGDQSSRLLQRWPGLIVYNAPNSELSDVFRQLNSEKDAFKKFVNGLAKKAKNQSEQQGFISSQITSESSAAMNPSTLRDKKWELVHSTYAMLVTLYVYRNIHVVEGPISAAYFSWLRAPNIQKFSKSELVKHLEWQLEQSQKDALSNYCPREVSSALSTVASSPRVQYIRKIPQPPRPNLILHFADDRKPKSIYASLPVVILGQADVPFAFKALKSFDSQSLEGRKTRTDAKTLIPIYKNFYYEP